MCCVPRPEEPRPGTFLRRLFAAADRLLVVYAHLDVVPHPVLEGVVQPFGCQPVGEGNLFLVHCAYSNTQSRFVLDAFLTLASRMSYGVSCNGTCPVSRFSHRLSSPSGGLGSDL